MSGVHDKVKYTYITLQLKAQDLQFYLAKALSREFYKIFKNSFFYRTPPVTASEWFQLEITPNALSRINLLIKNNAIHHPA